LINPTKKAVGIDKNYLYKLCHIGGMSLHKGYQLLRQAVHELPPNLPLQFTIIDHRLISAAEHYSSIWGGYQIDFVASVPMDEMPLFYSSHDVLIAPSIWPESFGLVSREALSAGLWVIASDSGALAEPILQSSQHVGEVIRPNQLQDLIDAIIEIPEKMKAKSLHVIKS
jgi:glycosyltransferase involved in cell wall biosynthesis